MENDALKLIRLNRAIEIANEFTLEYNDFIDSLQNNAYKDSSIHIGVVTYKDPFWINEVPGFRNRTYGLLPYENGFAYGNDQYLRPADIIPPNMPKDRMNMLNNFILMVQKWALYMDYEKMQKNFTVLQYAKNFEKTWQKRNYTSEYNKSISNGNAFKINYYNERKPLRQSLIKLHMDEMKLLANDESRLFAR